MKTWRRLLSTVLLLTGCICSFMPKLSAETAEPAVEKGLSNPFFAMDTIFGTPGKRDTSVKEQAAMVKELGYAGIGSWGDINNLRETLEELDRNGLKAFPPYYGMNLDPGKQKYDPELKEAIRLLKGRDTAIWISIVSREYKRSSPEGDPRAVEILRQISNMAQEAGLRVALYPHTGFWLERVEDAVRVAKKVDRENVGVTFNLCHWLRVDDEKNMRPLLELAMPYLFVVTINGADRGGKDWDSLIQTLDRGSFDTYQFLKTLKELGYAGPIGLQGYGIKGDAYDNLKRSMEAWRKLSTRVAAE